MCCLRAFALSLLFVGCMDVSEPAAQQPSAPPKPAEIGEFDQKAGKEVVKLDAKVSNPITGPVEILKAVEVKAPTLLIEQALNFFNANEGRFPKSHEEFMTQIISANKIQLPVLPSGLDYQYDVAGHRLVIVNTADGKTVE